MIYRKKQCPACQAVWCIIADGDGYLFHLECAKQIFAFWGHLADEHANQKVVIRVDA